MSICGNLLTFATDSMVYSAAGMPLPYFETRNLHLHTRTTQSGGVGTSATIATSRAFFSFYISSYSFAAAFSPVPVVVAVDVLLDFGLTSLIRFEDEDVKGDSYSARFFDFLFK